VHTTAGYSTSRLCKVLLRSGWQPLPAGQPLQVYPPLLYGHVKQSLGVHLDDLYNTLL